MTTYFKKSMIVLVLFLAMLPVLAAAETAITPGDFIHSHKLKITLEGAIHSFTLPRFVYEGLIQSQRLDLAVFNSNAEIVPFTVRESTPPTIVNLPEVMIPFYELPPDSRAESLSGVGPLDIYVQTSAGGQIVSITSSGRRDELRERRYILDFSSIEERGEAVRRELRLAMPDITLSARVSVFESRDLRDWRPLLTDAPLLQLQSGGSRLISDRIELPRAPRRYVLLRVQDVDPSFELEGVWYSVTIQTGDFEKDANTAEIEGTPITDGGSPAFEYDTLGAFPISGVNFLLQEPGFHWIRLFSRSEVNGEWRARATMSLSMIMSQDGSVTSNAPTTTNMLEDRFWRIEFDRAFSGAPPVMEIRWRPAEVFFMAQGGGSYALLFGSARRDSLSALQNASFLGSTYAAAAEIGSPIDPAENPLLAPGSAHTSKTPREEAEWQRYLVWGLLVLGGVMLSVMAFKLLKKN